MLWVSMVKERIVILAMIGLLLLVACATSKQVNQPIVNEEPVLIGANYYPWYDLDRWETQEYTNTPSLGKYDSSNSQVIDQHIQWALDAGIDFFVVEWCGEPGSPTDQVFTQMLNSPSSNNLKYAVFYDSAINLCPGWGYDDRPVFDADFDADRTKGGKFLDDMRYIADSYFDHPNYLKIDGRPLVVFYPVGGWTNAESYLDEMHDQMAEMGHEIYAVADVMGWDKDDVRDYPWGYWGRYFNAIAGGIMHCQAVIDDPNRDEFMVELDRWIGRYHDEALRQGLGFIPPVIVGFDNKVPALTAIPRNGGMTMRRSWEIAARNLDDTRMAIVMTFNEWHEGTEIEPSEEYGSFYLELLKELRGTTD